MSLLDSQIMLFHDSALRAAAGWVSSSHHQRAPLRWAAGVTLPAQSLASVPSHKEVCSHVPKFLSVMHLPCFKILKGGGVNYK